MNNHVISTLEKLTVTNNFLALLLIGAHFEQSSWFQIRTQSTRMWFLNYRYCYQSRAHWLTHIDVNTVALTFEEREKLILWDQLSQETRLESVSQSRFVARFNGFQQQIFLNNPPFWKGSSPQVLVTSWSFGLVGQGSNGRLTNFVSRTC